MSQTKHRLFKVGISDDGKFSFDSSVEKQINDFLAESNYVYINHSITTLTEDSDKFGNTITVNRFLALSLIYKDLNSTSFDLTGTSKKTQKVVKKEMEKGDKLNNPVPETDFDKEVQRHTSPELPIS